MLCTKNNGLNSSNYLKRIITLVLYLEPRGALGSLQNRTQE